MSLSSDIKEYALSIGYDRVGFTTAEKFPVYEKELTERREMYDWAILREPRDLLKSVEPRNIMPGAKSIIVTVTDYFKQSYPQALVGKVGRAYLSFGGRPVHPIHQARSRLLREFLEKQGCQVGQDLFVLPARLSGARAGVTNYGKNCFAFAEGVGSFIYIVTYLVDVELEYDEPTMEVRCPDKCTVCIDACPTGALYEPLKMNPRRCIAYNSYATPEGRWGNVPKALPLDIRDSMDTWVYGCDICQQVCPRNQARIKMKLPRDAYLEHVAGDFSLDKLLNMSEDHFKERVSRLLHYIPEKRYFQRNAAVALGNLGAEEAIPALTQAMQDPDELVRGHAAWALGKIGGSQAKQLLEASLSTESSDYAKEEIRAALAR